MRQPKLGGVSVGAAREMLPSVGPERVLIVGDGGETALVAAISHATELSRGCTDQALEDAGSILWIRSLPSAIEISQRLMISRALVNDALLEEAPSIVDARSRVVPLQSIRQELESRFGRVYSLGGESPERFIRTISKPSRGASLAKRGMECSLTAILFAVTVPLLLILSALYRLVFGAAQFVRDHEMVGKQGEPLTITEFSPRPVNIEPGSRADQVAQSIERNLRRMHLNGAPALAQVLSGQLSLVGPMPLSRESFERAVAENPLYSVRTIVRPGMISLARVRLKNASAEYDLTRALEYDLFYIKHRSLGLDARILIRASLILASDIVVTSVRIGATALSLGSRAVAQRLNGGPPRASALAPPPMPVEAGGESPVLAPTLLIGAGAGAVLLIRELQRNRASGLWPVALVDDNIDLIGTRIYGVPVLGTTEAISAIVLRERIQAIVIAIPSANPGQMQRLVDQARSSGVPVSAMPSIGRILSGAAPTALVEVPVSDLLGRPLVEISPIRAQAFLGGKRVLVTGAVGSIGREVVIQALRGEPAVIYGLDINESDLYDLQQELARRELSTKFIPVVGSVCETEQIDRLMRRTCPHAVFHAAAYKHVPLMEDYPHEAVRTNIGGTWTMATASARAGVERFVLVSTDKAVNPTSVMGATKRVAELIVQDVGARTGLSVCAVRFGNVLGSRGSVIPLFERQIEAGGPLTITDPGMMRYFMTIPEAAGLIIEAGAFGDRGVVYMLDMGEPVRILDLANRLIELKGLRPGTDIEVKFTGLRPGEKLFEELSLDFEQARATPHAKIRILDEGSSRRAYFAQGMAEVLLQMIKESESDQVRDAILDLVGHVDHHEARMAKEFAGAQGV